MKQYFIVVKSFSIDNQIVIMKDDILEFISKKTEENSFNVVVDYYFLVKKSWDGEGLEINLNTNKVIECLEYYSPPKQLLK